MTDSNRTQLLSVREVTYGVTPTTPRMRTARITGEGLTFKPEFIQSDELRADRMNADPIKVDESNSGPINVEISYPVPNSPLSDWIQSMMYSSWEQMPERDNDGTADSVITAVTDTTDVFTVTTGAAFVAGHLLRSTGFTNSANNGVNKVTTGGTTSVAVLGAGLVAEAAPPATARLKVVGFMGASGDITALADGLGSTALDFTTLGLKVGQWVRPGGIASATAFAFQVTAGAALRNDSWARITAIAANKLTLDNLPADWTTDSGTGKTIQVFVGDRIKNGTTRTSVSIERGFLAQSVPSYILQKGMVVSQAEFDTTVKDKAKATFTFMGLTGSVSTTAQDASPDAATTNPIMSASGNVGRISAGGSALSGPNWVRSVKVAINNNVRPIDALRGDGLLGPVDTGTGEFGVTATVETYFGSAALYSAFIAGTPTSVGYRMVKENQAIILQMPRLTYTDGAPSAGGKNQDVMLSLQAMASYDSLTAAHLLIDRVEYVPTIS